MTMYDVKMMVNSPEMFIFGTVLAYNRVTILSLLFYLGIVSGGWYSGGQFCMLLY